MNNKEIGEELFITENTVKYHKPNMLAKTGFTTTVDLCILHNRKWIDKSEILMKIVKISKYSY